MKFIKLSNIQLGSRPRICGSRSINNYLPRMLTLSSQLPVSNLKFQSFTTSTNLNSLEPLSVDSNVNPPPQFDTTPHFIDLTSERTLLKMSGKDTIKFINGLCTNKLDSWLSDIEEGADKIQYTSFLTPQGRVMFDGFLYALPSTSTPTVIVDIPTYIASIALPHFKRYKLISKVDIEPLDQYKIYSIGGKIKAKEELTEMAEIVEEDPRWKNQGLGLRVLSKQDLSDQLSSKYQSIPTSDYQLKLMMKGIAELPTLVSGQALPMESNMELFNGVHFRKGCYIGQELTIRTHHKGVIRKRIFGVEIIGQKPPLSIDQNLYSTISNKPKSKPIGKILALSSTTNYALIQFRVDDFPKDRSNVHVKTETHELELKFMANPVTEYLENEAEKSDEQ